MLKKLLTVAALSVALASAPAESVESTEPLNGLNVALSVEKVLVVRNNEDLFESNNTKLNNSYGAHGGVFYKMDTGLEFGVEAGYKLEKQQNKSVMQALSNIDRSIENKMMTLMGKATYYADLSSSFAPYIGVGAGIGKVDFSIEDFNSISNIKDSAVVDKVKFAYSGEAGFALTMSPSVILTVGAEYFGLLDIKKDDFTNNITISEFKDTNTITTGNLAGKIGLKLFL